MTVVVTAMMTGLSRHNNSACQNGQSNDSEQNATNLH